MPPNRTKRNGEEKEESKKVGKTKEELKDLLLRYGCNKLKNPDARPKWLESHIGAFSHVQKLGKTSYDDYEGRLAKDDPVFERVQKLSRKANSCHGKVEKGWRSHEHLIFQSLEDILICPTCFGRTPRSENRVAQDKNSTQANTIKDWAEIELCRCSQNRKPLFCQLFNGDESASVPYPKDIEEDLVKKEPDLVYGLREAGSFNKLLKSPVPRRPGDRKGQMIKHSINLTSFSKESNKEALYFPFLLLEAKSDRAADNWFDILVQSGLPLKACLDIQRLLFQFNVERSSPRSDPLVWFLMNKGEVWKVCAAYIELNGGGLAEDSFSFEITELWNGFITEHDGALQLILIMDYISEWADEYRDGIIKELDLLRQANERLSYHDRCSRPHTIPSSIIAIPSEPPGQEYDWELERQLYSLNYECSELGSVRHANSVTIRFCVLFITPQNVESLTDSYQESIAKRIFYLIKDNDLVPMGLNELEKIEKAWLGADSLEKRPHLEGLDASEFLTALTFGTYLAEDWTQVLEISGLAIHPDAMDKLTSLANLKSGTYSLEASSSVKAVTGEDIAELRQMSSRQRLSAAVAHVSVRLEMKVSTNANDGRRVDKILFPQDNGSIRTVVHAIYRQKWVKEREYKGFQSPGASKIKHFLLNEVKNISLNNSKVAAPVMKFEDLGLSKNEAVLLYDVPSGNDGHKERKPKICLYLLEHPNDLAMSKQSLATTIKETLKSKNIYNSIQCDGILGWRSITSMLKENEIIKRTWNIGHLIGKGSMHENQIKNWMLRLDPKCTLLDDEIIPETPTVEQLIKTPAPSTDESLRSQETLYRKVPGEEIDNSPPTYHTSEEVESPVTPFRAMESSDGEGYNAPTTRSQDSTVSSREGTPGFREAIGTVWTIGIDKLVIGKDKVVDKVGESFQNLAVSKWSPRSSKQDRSNASAS